MPKFEIEVSKDFSCKNHLLYQQLQTLKEISDSNQSISEQESFKQDQAETSISWNLNKWQLLPANISLHKWQKDCLKLWLDRKQGTVKVATGGGKTKFALAAAQELQRDFDPNLKLAIVVPTIPLMNQWLDELSDSNIPKSQIGRLGGGYTVDDISDLKIILTVINSAFKKLPEIVEN